MNKRYFIIYFWGLKTVQVPHLPHPNIDEKGQAQKPFEIEKQFYGNMNCVTDGEYPSCDQFKAEALVS